MAPTILAPRVFFSASGLRARRPRFLPFLLPQGLPGSLPALSRGSRAPPFHLPAVSPVPAFPPPGPAGAPCFPARARRSTLLPHPGPPSTPLSPPDLREHPREPITGFVTMRG